MGTRLMVKPRMIRMCNSALLAEETARYPQLRRASQFFAGWPHRLGLCPNRLLPLYCLFGEQAEYMCSPGFSLGGSASGNKSLTLRCNASGSSSPPARSVRECKRVSCGLPPDIPNAVTNTEHVVRFSMFADYTCNPGYAAEGTKDVQVIRRRWTSIGEFSKSSAGSSSGTSCRMLSCGQAFAFAGANRQMGTFSVCDTATYNCEDGKNL